MQTKALWNHYDDSASPKFIQQRQVMHVGILSCGNFIGRLSSGTYHQPSMSPKKKKTQCTY